MILEPDTQYPLPLARNVAAIFSTMNRKEVACECIRLLDVQTTPPGKIFVVDNDSTDGTAHALEAAGRTLAPEISIVRSSQNLGNAGGIQLLMDQAFGEGFEYVWILDDDSWPEADALERLLSKNLPCDSIRSSLVLAPGSDDVSWTYEIPTPSGRWKSIESLKEFPEPSWNRVRRSWLGALIPKAAYVDAGPLRGELFLRGEDEDYPRRLERLGYSVWVSTDSILRHPPGGPYHNLAIGNYRICLERNLTEDKLYYRIRNLLWIKTQESGILSAILLAMGILYLLTMHFRPLFPALRSFRDAFADSFSNRLGKRPTSGN